MTEVTFVYEGSPTIIQCNKEDKMNNICQKFASKMKVDVNNLIFLYGGDQVNKELKFEDQAVNIDKERQQMSIIVKNLNEDEQKDENIQISKEIICPECLEPCLINIEDFKINLCGCEKDHKKTSLLLTDFKKTQMIDESKIICNFCEQNKSSSYEKKFYKCL